MERPVYHSLDKPSAFFGIRGRFTSWMVGILLVVGVVALVVGTMSSTFVGIIVFVAGAVGVYVWIMSLQGKESDRAFSMRINSKKYVRYVRTPPGAARHMWRQDRLDPGK